MTLRAASLVAILALAACAAEDRPQGAQLSAELESSEVTAVGFATPAERPEPVTPKACEPGTWRNCKIYSPGAAGTWNCWTYTQGCRSDGMGYHACNDIAAVEADPVKPVVPPPPAAPVQEEDAGTPAVVK